MKPKRQIHRGDAENTEIRNPISVHSVHSVVASPSSRVLSDSEVSPVRPLSPEKSGILRLIRASEDFGISVDELAARAVGAGIKLSPAAAMSAANALCDLDYLVVAGEPPRFFAKEYRQA